MAQTTLTDDYFTIEGEDEHVVSFAPSRKLKLGPFFGWRWLFFGYVFNVNTIRLSSKHIDINTTLYTPAIAVDIVYRKLGDGYTLRSMQNGEHDATDMLEGMEIDGLDINVRSVNAYYVVNKRKYSHQAAFNQTNRQLKNAGSWIFGTGYNRCTVSMDWGAFKKQVKKRVKGDERYMINDSALVFNKMSYRSVPLSVGYGYNWVFAKNWLFCASAQAGLCYKTSYGETADDNKAGFTFDKVHLDGIGRFGLVYNNTRWYAGCSAILRTNNYRTSRFVASNIFGSFNAYIGYNFVLKKKYRKNRA
jgi:hypothetical protein